jgi:hypothetical protein
MPQSSNNNSHPVAIGIGIAALAAAAAGAYYLYGTEKGPQRRRALKGWMLRMKADVMEEIENLKDVNEEMYRSTVDKIAEKYKQLKNVDPDQITALAMRMHSHWKDIQRDINQATTSVRSARKPASTSKKAKRKTSGRKKR